MTKSEAIILKIINILETNLSSVTITRSRVNPFEEQFLKDSTTVSIEPVNNIANESAVGIIDWTFAIEFNFYRASAQPEKDLDNDVSTFFGLLLSNRELDGLSQDVFTTGIEYSRFQGEQDVGEIKIGFNVIYRTTQTNLSA